MGSSRKKSELKETVTSIRMTAQQHQKIKEKAENVGMKPSSYMLLSALNGGDAGMAEKLVHMQNIVNISRELAEKYEPEKSAYLQEEMDKVWQE